MVGQYQTSIYKATVKVMIVRPPDDSLTAPSDLTEGQLAATFVQLILTRPFLNAAEERLNHDVSAGDVEVQQVRGTQLMEISVEDNDPQRAADTANALVDISIEQYEAIQTGRFVSSEDSLQAQLAQVEAQISELQLTVTEFSEENYQAQLKDLETRIEDLQAEIENLQIELVTLQDTADFSTTPGRIRTGTPAATTEQRIEMALNTDRLDELQFLQTLYQQIYVNASLQGGGTSGEGNRLDQLQSTVDLYQQIYATLLSNYESIRLARLRTTPSVVLVEEATAPRRPVRPNPLINMGLGGLIGLGLASAIVFFKEQLNETLRDATEASNLLQLPILAFIGQERGLRRSWKSGSIYAIENPQTPFAEAFQVLRVNLDFSQSDYPLRTILVTSPSASEGKTTVAINLAAVIAQSEKQVTLVDADLRNPSVHRLLNLESDRVGLIDVLLGEKNLDKVGQPSAVENLNVIASGEVSMNPVGLLASQNMDEVLSALKRESDVAIIDSPPFHLAETSVLAAGVDGVLLVIQPGRTLAGAALQMLEQLERAQARILGMVLNRVRGRGDGGGYQYYGASSYPRYDLHQQGDELEDSM